MTNYAKYVKLCNVLADINEMMQDADEVLTQRLQVNAQAIYELSQEYKQLAINELK